jgi:hypothetical protein
MAYYYAFQLMTLSVTTTSLQYPMMLLPFEQMQQVGITYP